MEEQNYYPTKIAANLRRLCGVPVDYRGDFRAYAIFKQWIVHAGSEITFWEPIAQGRNVVVASARHKWPPSEMVKSAASAERTSSTSPSARELIDRWRKKYGITLESLAELAKISISTLRRIMRGEFDYSTHTESLKAVASVIGCDWKDLRPHV